MTDTITITILKEDAKSLSSELSERASFDPDCEWYHQELYRRFCKSVDEALLNSS